MEKRHCGKRSVSKTLRDHGAEVFLCEGEQQGNTFHKRAVIVDRLFLDVGSANVMSHTPSTCMRFVLSGGARHLGQARSGELQ